MANNKCEIIEPSSGSLPGVAEAFEILAGRHQPPSHIDRASYLSLCQAVLEDAIDQAEIRQTGRPVFGPCSRLENTNIVRLDVTDNQIPLPEGHLETNTLRSEVSEHQT